MNRTSGSAAILAAARPFLEALEMILLRTVLRCCCGQDGRAPRFMASIHVQNLEVFLSMNH